MNYGMRRNDAWNPLAEFRRELDSLFDDFFTPARQTWREGNVLWSPKSDIIEEDEHYLVSIETPGVPKDAIKIEVADNTVTISGERRDQKFQRSFSLPAGVDVEKIAADYRDGVLQLMIPKAESAKPRQIKIGSGAGFFGKLLGDSRKKEEENSSKPQEHVA